ncbi:hypothetical protein [Janthinobacterium sp. B9-8]|uniref:hypothetical protein n=1 Tax=Janthinobacterium sp. B9-8 TaxID=1236179 RepID=UPI00061D1FEC|nr:hypothetical protein [Janthinobacterium sp. B9-8]AMC35073.1 hypothetical protein VN23_10860 [Janthinobacterium sp. B9-8]
MWKKIRIVILLLILAKVAQFTWLDKGVLEWKKNLYVAVYPVNVSGSAEVSAYLQSLNKDDFEPLTQYFAAEAKQYQLNIHRPFEFQLGGEVKEIPPVPPSDGHILNTMLWSLKFRYFAWNNSPKVSVPPDIRLYLLYYDPTTHPQLSHSTALNKGRIGRINLFAAKAYAKQNLVIVGHELLHTLNATDKYDLNSNLPLYPDGFAEPDKAPRYPQGYAEIMGGRIPLSEVLAKIPEDLSRTLIGEKTAQEIGWLKEVKNQ